MANEQVLLINRDDLMRYTSMGGNVDWAKVQPHIFTAQQIHLQTLLGTRLLEKCRQIIADDELNLPIYADYKVLIEQYITPVLVYYSMSDFLPFLAYEISNKGVLQHQAEASLALDKPQIDSLIQKFKDKSEFFTRRLEAYLCDKGSATFPELITRSSDDMPPNPDELFHGWVM